MFFKKYNKGVALSIYLKIFILINGLFCKSNFTNFH